MERTCDGYLDHLAVERNLSPHTLEAYSRDLRALRSYLATRGIRRPEQVQEEHLRGFSRFLARRGLAASSQARSLSAVRRFFEYLVREGMLPTSAARGLEGPTPRQRLPQVLSREEAARLVAAVDGPAPRGLRDRAALELLYSSGLRASELCLLRLDELHLPGGVVRPRGKGSKERVVPLGRPAQRALECYIEQGRPALLRGRPSAYVFIGNRARPLSRMALFLLVRRAALCAGIERSVSPHTLRHAFATHLLAGGADLRSVQEMLGHASIASTEIYTHVETSELRRAVDRCHPLGKGAASAADGSTVRRESGD